MAKIKLFLTLLTSTAIIFSSAYYGPKIFGSESKVSANQTNSVAVKKEQKKASVPVTKTETVINADTAVSSALISPGNLTGDLQILTENYPEIEIAAESSFSLLDFLKKKNLDKSFSSDVLSATATLIYEAVLPTNFVIEERNISNELPKFAKLGFESKVSVEQGLDFAFYNPNKTKYILTFQTEQDQVNVTLSGQPFAEQYKIRTGKEQTFKPRTIIQYSPQLPSGQKKIVTAGEDGQMVQVYKDVYQKDQFMKSQFVAEDYYPPVYRVEIRSLNTPSSQQPTATPAADNPQANSNQTTPAASSSIKEANQAAASTAAESDLWGKPNEESK